MLSFVLNFEAFSIVNILVVLEAAVEMNPTGLSGWAYC